MEFRSWKMAASVLGAVVLLSGTAAALGMPFPPWPDRELVRMNSERLAAVERKQVRTLLEIKRDNFYANQRAQAEYKRRGAPVPAWLLEEELRLRDEIRDLERMLN